MSNGPGVSKRKRADGKWRVRWRQWERDDSGELKHVQCERLVSSDEAADLLYQSVLFEIETGQVVVGRPQPGEPRRFTAILRSSDRHHAERAAEDARSRLAQARERIKEAEVELARLRELAILLETEPLPREDFEGTLGLRPACPSCSRRLVDETGPLCWRCEADEVRP